MCASFHIPHHTIRLNISSYIPECLFKPVWPKDHAGLLFKKQVNAFDQDFPRLSSNTPTIRTKITVDAGAFWTHRKNAKPTVQ